MITGFEKIVEERIRQAQKKGEFDNMPGSGKPLKFEDDSYTSKGHNLKGHNLRFFAGPEHQ